MAISNRFTNRTVPPLLPVLSTIHAIERFPARNQNAISA